MAPVTGVCQVHWVGSVDQVDVYGSQLEAREVKNQVGARKPPPELRGVSQPLRWLPNGSQPPMRLPDGS